MEEEEEEEEEEEVQGGRRHEKSISNGLFIWNNMLEIMIIP